MNIRQKFLIGFAFLVIAVSVVGAFMLNQVGKLGRTVDVTLKENYQSVIICQKVNEALERIDSGILFLLTDDKHFEEDFFTNQIAIIHNQWTLEMNNITVPTEAERTEKVQTLLKEYLNLVSLVTDTSITKETRSLEYRKKVYPLFLELKKEVGGILEINQENMAQANNLARSKAYRLHWQGIVLLVASALFILCFSMILINWIQNPLKKLIHMTNEIAEGNYDLSLDSISNDEIGQLARSFNTMTIALRDAKRQLMQKLYCSKRMNKDVFDKLPAPITVIDLQTETVDVTTQKAAQYFGFTEGKKIEDISSEWFHRYVKKVRETGVIYEANGQDDMIQKFIDGREYFFQPTVIPIPPGGTPEQIIAVGIILRDVTMAHEQMELKKSVISTVSHQLKTPLTSLQMSIYLLLEEKCGSLTPEQVDLLLTMREESQRLTDIIGDLLDLNQASSLGNLPYETKGVNELISDAADRFSAECQSRSIQIETVPDPTATIVSVVRNRIEYVFDNLIANAIRFTSPGGKIVLSAVNKNHVVEFSVADSGSGMSEEVIKHIFEPFYRGPGQESTSGVGLGLSIVKEIVTVHGGDVKVQSQENEGTIMTFTIPLTTGEKSCY